MNARARAIAGTRSMRFWTEFLLIAVLVVLGFWYGRFAFLHNAASPDYHYFGPAVMVATGQGFTAPYPETGTPFAEFLASGAGSLSPADAVPAVATPPDQFHHSVRYLLLVAGYWWRWAGISWEALADVAASLHVVAVVGAYATARLFVPSPLAFAAAAWLCVSPWQLSMVAHVRDYSKGAFIVAALPLILLMALRVPTRARFLAAAAAAGFVLGIGFGFRRDIVIMLPITLVCMVLFRGRRPWSEWKEKLAGIGTFILTFLIVSAPVLVPLVQGGSHTMHVILLGYAPGFDRALGVESPGYRLLPFYDDGYTGMVVDTHHALAGGEPITTNPSVEYDAAGQRLLLSLLRHFPADIFVRALGAGNTILNMTFTAPAPGWLTQPLPLQDLTARIHGWLHVLSGYGGWFGAAFVILASLGGVHQGLLAALLILVLTGYSSLQFDLRHYFHLQVVPVIALVTLVWSAIRFLRPATLRLVGAGGSPERGPRKWGTLAARAGAGVATVLALTVMPLVGLRVYQSSHVAGVLDAYLRGPRAPVLTVEAPLEADSWLVEWRDALPPIHPGSAQRSAHYLVEFRSMEGRGPVTLTLRYRRNAGGVDFSRVISVASAPGPTRVGFQAFSVPGLAEFVGIELGQQAFDSLQGIYRVTSGGPAALPLDVVLPSDWQERRLYQRLRAEGHDNRAFVPQHVVCAIDPGCRGLLGALERSTSAQYAPEPGNVRTLHAADIARVAADGIHVDGPAETESSYLVEWQPLSFEHGGTLILRGRLEEGGLLAGLLHDGRWYLQASVRTPGDFALALPVPAGGTYVPLLTNSIPPGHRNIRFEISRIAFLPRPPTGQDSP